MFASDDYTDDGWPLYKYGANGVFREVWVEATDSGYDGIVLVFPVDKTVELLWGPDQAPVRLVSTGHVRWVSDHPYEIWVPEHRLAAWQWATRFIESA